MAMKPLLISATLTAFAIALPAASPAWAASPGENEYMNACAACHGADGTGTGPVAGVISSAVPDLTALSQKNEGKFPLLYVVQTIDGRSGVRAHGSDKPDWEGGMPVWGDRFMADAGDAYGPYGTELMVRGRVLALAEYLATLQK